MRSGQRRHVRLVTELISGACDFAAISVCVRARGCNCKPAPERGSRARHVQPADVGAFKLSAILAGVMDGERSVSGAQFCYVASRMSAVNSALLHCASDVRVDLLKLDDREVTMSCLRGSAAGREAMAAAAM
jgi:hypothetical protein